MEQRVTAKLLDTKKAQALIMALARGQKSFTEDEASYLLDWAEQTLRDLDILKSAITGDVDLAFNGTDLLVRPKAEAK